MRNRYELMAHRFRERAQKAVVNQDKEATFLNFALAAVFYGLAGSHHTAVTCADLAMTFDDWKGD